MPFNTLVYLCLVVNVPISLSFADIKEIRKESFKEWNYTPAQYKKQGSPLRFSSESSFISQEIQKEVLKGLDFILAEKDGVVRTTGVNWQDLYHVHVLCPGKCAKAVSDDVFEFESELRRASYAATTENFDITQENLPRFIKVIQAHEPKAAALIKKALLTKECAQPHLLFHSFEDNREQYMEYPGDPRRNILVPFKENPRGYTPKEIQNASSYTDDYCLIVSLPFLVSQKGEVHMTIGVDTNLVRVVTP